MPNAPFPPGKFMAVVKVGPKGQIVIPAEMREMFAIAPGDSLLLLSDVAQGIAIPPAGVQGKNTGSPITRRPTSKGWPQSPSFAGAVALRTCP